MAVAAHPLPDARSILRSDRERARPLCLARKLLRISPVPHPSVATYRLQVHGGFDLHQAATLVGYLSRLGVSHAYTSPLLRSVPGSPHGYDTVDPTRIDPDRGGEAALDRFHQALEAHGLRHLLDVVPNHMATATPHNPWWWDVLRRGRSSPYARFFDIEWEPDTTDPGIDLQGRVLVPVLGRAQEDAVRAGEIALDRLDGEPVVRYFEHLFPLSLSRLASEDREAVEGGAELCPDRLLGVLERQPYRLSHWRRARGELNYRRFFDVSDLAGVRQEDPEVFAATHELVLRLVGEGKVHGLRIDHPDGLRDPRGYLERLAEATGGAWTVVEKILEPGEALREDWPVAGTTGYDFGAVAGGLFVDPRGERPLSGHWREVSGDDSGWEETVRARKLRAMAHVLPAEMARLEALFLEYLREEGLGRRDVAPSRPDPSSPNRPDHPSPSSPDHLSPSRPDPSSLRRPDHPSPCRPDERRDLCPEPSGDPFTALLADAPDVLREVLAAFPVYRTYVRPGQPMDSADEEAVRHAIARARATRPDLDPRLFDLLADALLLRRESGAELAARFQQVSGPVMAKGVEDTAFYSWVRFVALNEVGDSPGRFGVRPAEFHAFCRERAARWPETLNAVSTHDSKRSADVRAGLWLLSEMPERWAEAVRRWRKRNRRHKTGGLPDGAAEYLLYQTLVGAWPLHPDQEGDRAWPYMEKAAREAKVHTTWTRPNPEYEGALRAFVEGVLDDADFVADLEAFVAPLLGPRRTNSLALTLLHLTAPGVPDLYQGDELWNRSLVDPDNRRPVDFDLRRRLLEGLEAMDVETVLQHADEGLPKLCTIHRALALRRRRPEVFGAGSGYEPVAAQGAKAEHAMAFVRTGPDGAAALALVPRLVLGLGDDWAGTRIPVPEGRWRNVLTGDAVVAGREVPVAELLARFPVALLEREAA